MGRLNGNMAIVRGAAGRGDMGQVIAQRFRDEDAQVMVSVRAMTAGESLIPIDSATATIVLNDHAWPCV